MWKFSIFIKTLQTFPDMNNNSLYADFAARFAKASLQSLIDSFNAQVGCRGWGSARACHDVALIDELKRRGIDLSAISQGGGTSFAHKVALDSDGQTLIIAD